MERYSGYVGFDVHKETISVGIAHAGRSQPLYYGEIRNDAAAVVRLVRQLRRKMGALTWCYEAGPCGYAVYRQLTALGEPCEVVAPGLILRKPGERIKNDRRDALMLARQHRSGDLSAVWVPDEHQEAMRDLSRAREDMKAIELKTRQRLGAFLLRHDRIYREGRSRWTQQHFRWLERQRFELEIHQRVFQEYVDAVIDAQRRVAALESEMRMALESWPLRAVAEGLMSLRGVGLITAVTVLAELGDISRFDNARQLMCFVGLVPGERSSGSKRRQTGITKTGNAHVRRVLVEAAWSYRFPARKTAVLQRRAERASPAVQAIAWKAQKRLCSRYRHLNLGGKEKCKVTTAVARELVGFVWAIAREVMPATQSQHAQVSA